MGIGDLLEIRDYLNEREDKYSAIKKFIQIKRKELYCIAPYIYWSPDFPRICLDGNFTPQQLRQMADFMEENENEGEDKNMENFNIKSWCKMFKDAPTVLMSEGMSRIMMGVILGEINREEMDDNFLYKVIKARSEAIGLIMEQNLMDFLSLLCEKPGNITMYLSLLREEQSKGNKASMENFCKMFPKGFPKQYELKKLWEAQKRKKAPFGNELDVDWWCEEEK